jgi:hypothetical protein
VAAPSCTWTWTWTRCFKALRQDYWHYAAGMETAGAERGPAELYDESPRCKSKLPPVDGRGRVPEGPASRPQLEGSDACHTVNRSAML